MQPEDKISLTYEQAQALGAKMLGDVGKARELTTADYNWPTTGDKTAVALWLLDDGLYKVPAGVSAKSGINRNVSAGTLVLVHGNPNGKTTITEFNGILCSSVPDVTVSGTHSQVQEIYLRVLDSLEFSVSPYDKYPLSAKQGNVLNGKITSANSRITALQPLTGTTAPDTTTVGTVGKMYIDTTNQTAYICVAADATIPEYTWKQITA